MGLESHTPLKSNKVNRKREIYLIFNYEVTQEKHLFPTIQMQQTIEKQIAATTLAQLQDSAGTPLRLDQKY